MTDILMTRVSVNKGTHNCKVLAESSFIVALLTAAMRSTSLRLLRMKQASASSILQQRDKLTNNRTKSEHMKNKGKFQNTKQRDNQRPTETQTLQQKSQPIKSQLTRPF